MYRYLVVHVHAHGRPQYSLTAINTDTNIKLTTL